MALFKTSTSSVPVEIEREIIQLVAGRFLSDKPPGMSDDWSEPYADLCSLRLVSKRGEVITTPSLFRDILLESSSLPAFVSKVRKFVALAITHPQLMELVEHFLVFMDPFWTIGPFGAEDALRPALALMRHLRSCEFWPSFDLSVTAKAFHPAARLTSMSLISLEDGPLRLDDLPCFSSLDQVMVDVCARTSTGPVATVTTLHLPQSLSILVFSASDPDQLLSRFQIALAQSVPSLRTLRIRGAQLSAEWFRPLILVQGPVITRLSLLATDCHALISRSFPFPEFQRNAQFRDAAYSKFHALVPLITQCPNLETVTVYDVHMPYLVEIRHPTLSCIILYRDDSFSEILQGAQNRDQPNVLDNNFGRRVLRSIHALSPYNFPALKTIRYAYEELTWAVVLKNQDLSGQWGEKQIQKALAGKGWTFLDGTDAPWPGDRCLQKQLEQAEVDE